MKIMPTAIPLTNPISATAKPASRASENSSWSDLLDKTLQELNNSQLKADETVQKFLTGEIQDIHTVMIAMGEARLSMQLAVEVRNKLVEAYQEISRMQV